eukprot:16493-Heterococcus_DN1.PRE.3
MCLLGPCCHLLIQHSALIGVMIRGNRQVIQSVDAHQIGVAHKGVEPPQVTAQRQRIDAPLIPDCALGDAPGRDAPDVPLLRPLVVGDALA